MREKECPDWVEFDVRVYLNEDGEVTIVPGFRVVDWSHAPNGEGQEQLDNWEKIRGVWMAFINNMTVNDFVRTLLDLNTNGDRPANEDGIKSEKDWPTWRTHRYGWDDKEGQA